MCWCDIDRTHLIILDRVRWTLRSLVTSLGKRGICWKWYYFICSHNIKYIWGSYISLIILTEYFAKYSNVLIFTHNVTFYWECLIRQKDQYNVTTSYKPRRVCRTRWAWDKFNIFTYPLLKSNTISSLIVHFC